MKRTTPKKSLSSKRIKSDHNTPFPKTNCATPKEAYWRLNANPSSGISKNPPEPSALSVGSKLKMSLDQFPAKLHTCGLSSSSSRQESAAHYRFFSTTAKINRSCASDAARSKTSKGRSAVHVFEIKNKNVEND